MPWEGLWDGRQLTVMIRGRSASSQSLEYKRAAAMKLTFFGGEENSRHGNVLWLGRWWRSDHVDIVLVRGCSGRDTFLPMARPILIDGDLCEGAYAMVRMNGGHTLCKCSGEQYHAL